MMTTGGTLISVGLDQCHMLDMDSDSNVSSPTFVVSRISAMRLPFLVTLEMPSFEVDYLYIDSYKI